MWKFNAKRFISDCGGPNEVEKLLGKPRTAPYRMMNTRYMTTRHFEEIKNAVKGPLNIDDYFEQDDNNDGSKRRTKGTSV